MNLLVFGASGMLGTTLVPALSAHGHTVAAPPRDNGQQSVELTEATRTASLIAHLKPDVVINLAGLTDVERCETHPQQAWSANVLAVENIAAACRVAGCHLIHVSTDQVYDGRPPRTENEACPGNYYALTKYAGELAALATSASVLRTNFFGASLHASRRSLTDWLFGSLTQGHSIQVFEDVCFSPLSMRTLCEMIHRIAHLQPQGIFNVGSREGMSKADFAFGFARALGLPEQSMTRASVSQSNMLRAWRPKDMRMSTAKIEAALQLAMPALEDEIELAAKDYRAHT